MTDRFILGTAYQAGPDPDIKRGADGRRDFFNARELELAAWQYLRKGREVGLQHVDGTLGHAEIVESYIWRAVDPWRDDDGAIIAKQGDWLLGAICDEPTFDAVMRGEFTGWSPQGGARRITPRSDS